MDMDRRHPLPDSRALVEAGMRRDADAVLRWLRSASLHEIDSAARQIIRVLQPREPGPLDFILRLLLAGSRYIPTELLEFALNDPVLLEAVAGNPELVEPARLSLVSAMVRLVEEGKAGVLEGVLEACRSGHCQAPDAVLVALAARAASPDLEGREEAATLLSRCPGAQKEHFEVWLSVDRPLPMRTAQNVFSHPGADTDIVLQVLARFDADDRTRLSEPLACLPHRTSDPHSRAWIRENGSGGAVYALTLHGVPLEPGEKGRLLEAALLRGGGLVRTILANLEGHPGGLAALDLIPLLVSSDPSIRRTGLRMLGDLSPSPVMDSGAGADPSPGG